MDTAVAELKLDVQHRYLSTKEIARALGYRNPARVGILCRKGEIPGAWQLGRNGNWRIYSKDFLAYLIARGIPTAVLDDILNQR
jgi:hypothetical protein